jgi:hypothetical protein
MSICPVSLSRTGAGVTCAGPPSRFEPYSRITGMGRVAENHHPTSAVGEIKAFDVKLIVARATYGGVRRACRRGRWLEEGGTI